MPDAFPAGPPTLSGDLLTINRLLQSPTQVARRLRTFVDLRFVSDQLLTQRLQTSGGAIGYEVSEPITTTRPVEAVAAGSEYPSDIPATGTAALAAVLKWGQGTTMSDESIIRSVYGGQVLDRALRKIVNSVIKQVDSVAMAAVASAVTATSAATAAWSATSGTTMLRDLELAIAKILDTNQGYSPNTVLMSSTKYAYLVSDPIVAALRRREATDNPVYAGSIEVIANLNVLVAPLSSLPSDDVWVLDNASLGGMADELDAAPGYTVDQMAVQVQSARRARADGWDLWGRRKTVPVIQEPAAGCKITST